MNAAALVALGEAFAQQPVFSPEGPGRVRFRQEAQSLIMTGNPLQPFWVRALRFLGLGSHVCFALATAARTGRDTGKRWK